MMTIDVIIPYSPDHTPESLLARTISSIEKQDIETNIHTIVDTDQNGPAWARNKGINQSDNQYIAFCDADDFWENGKLSSQLKMLQNSEAGICLTQTADTEGEETFVVPFDTTEEFVEDIFFGRTRSFTSSILIDITQTDARFDEEIYRREDHLFALETAADAGICFVDDVLVRIYKHDQGLSSNEKHKLFIGSQHTFYNKSVKLFPKLDKYESEFWSETYHGAGRHYYFNSEFQKSISYLKKSLDKKYRLKTIISVFLSYILLYHERLNDNYI